jgi:hypothetical protein
MDGLTRGWRHLQVRSVALHDLCSSSDGIVHSTKGEFDGMACGTTDNVENE